MRMPPKCKECGFEAVLTHPNLPETITCSCGRCQSIRANGFCSPVCENNFNEEKAYHIDRARRTA